MNTTEITHKNLVKKFHTLLSKYAIRNEDKLTILGTYGVETSLDLTIDQLVQVCDVLQRGMPRCHEEEKQQEFDKLRKRLIASIFGWRKSLGCTTDMTLVKAIACRAAEVPEGYALSVRFNSIPVEKLRSLYNAFGHMAKDMSKVKEMNQEMIDKLTTLN